MPWARTRSSPAPAGRPPRWGGPAATGSPWPRRAAPPSGPRAGSSWARRPLPGAIRAHRHPAARRRARRRGGRGATRPCWTGSGRRPALPARGHRLLGRLPRRRGRAARRAAGHHPLGPGPPAGRRSTPRSPSTPIPIYIRDGKYWSSAGVTAGIDLSLALVQEDLGVDVAQTVARWLVMFLHRPGGQTQFASPVWVPRRRALDRPGRADRSSRPRPAATTGCPPSPRRPP